MRATPKRRRAKPYELELRRYRELHPEEGPPPDLTLEVLKRWNREPSRLGRKRRQLRAPLFYILHDGIWISILVGIYVIVLLTMKSGFWGFVGGVALAVYGLVARRR